LAPKNPADRERRYSHLLKRWSKEIEEWFFTEKPASVAAPLIYYCSYTRHEAKKTRDQTALRRGKYFNPFDNEECTYMGGFRPRVMENWLKRYGPRMVASWRVVTEAVTE